MAPEAKRRKRTNRSRSPIKLTELSASIQRKRTAEGLSLRQVARQVGLGASTLWRLERGRGVPDSATLVYLYTARDIPRPGRGVPDSATLARLAEWLSVPLERLVDVARPTKRKAIVYYEDENTPDIVEAHLRADRRLSPETAKALVELFRVAYNQFARKKR